MSLRKVLRAAIVIQWISITSFALASGALASNLPSHLQDYLQWEAGQRLTTTPLLLLVPMGALLFIYLMTSVSLFLYRPWAKRAYVIVGLLFYGATLFTGPVVEHAAASAIEEVASIAFGFIVALLFFTDVYKVKERSAATVRKPRIGTIGLCLSLVPWVAFLVVIIFQPG